jgi:hypothetical protein
VSADGDANGDGKVVVEREPVPAGAPDERRN